VIDQGIGIAADEIERIFDPFYRIDTSKEEVEGSGLGLSIVKECVDRLNGTIRVDSVLGEGSTFTVKLPLPPY
jgi:signal transduction histidine kinase